MLEKPTPGNEIGG